MRRKITRKVLHEFEDLPGWQLFVAA